MSRLFVLTACLTVALTGFVGSATAQTKDVLVFAAASLKDALDAISGFDEVRKPPLTYPVVSERGVAELGWA